MKFIDYSDISKNMEFVAIYPENKKIFNIMNNNRNIIMLIYGYMNTYYIDVNYRNFMALVNMGKKGIKFTHYKNSVHQIKLEKILCCNWDYCYSEIL
jgi:hypothetical protein